MWTDIPLGFVHCVSLHTTWSPLSPSLPPHLPLSLCSALWVQDEWWEGVEAAQARGRSLLHHSWSKLYRHTVVRQQWHLPPCHPTSPGWPFTLSSSLPAVTSPCSLPASTEQPPQPTPHIHTLPPSPITTLPSPHSPNCTTPPTTCPVATAVPYILYTDLFYGHNCISTFFSS